VARNGFTVSLMNLSHLAKAALIPLGLLAQS